MRNRNELDWTIIADPVITIDFSACRTWYDVHEKLEKGFGFPGYYGANWSAFWDLLRDFCIGRSPTEVRYVGLERLPEELHDYRGKILEISKRAEKKYATTNFISLTVEEAAGEK